MPIRAIVCGPAALSAMVTLPDSVPVTVGLKITSIVQLEPGLRLPSL